MPWDAMGMTDAMSPQKSGEVTAPLICGFVMCWFLLNLSHLESHSVG